MTKYIFGRTKTINSKGEDKMIVHFGYEFGDDISSEEYIRRYEDGKPLEWEFVQFHSGDDNNCILFHLFQDKAESPEYENLLNALWMTNRTYETLER